MPDNAGTAFGLADQPSSSQKHITWYLAAMDPITVIGAFAAMVQLAQCCLGLAEKLERLESARGEIRRFAVQVHNFSQTTEGARLSLSRHCYDHSDSAVMTYLQQHRVLDGLSLEAEMVEDHVQLAARRVSSMANGFRLLVRVRWLINRESILEVSTGMESIKASLILVLLTVQLEVTLSSREESPPGAADEIRRLESEMYAARFPPSLQKAAYHLPE